MRLIHASSCWRGREHERWLGRKLKTGWRFGDPRDDALRLHPCIRPWEELPDDERDKDRMMIRRMPEIVDLAGMTLARLGEPADLRIGVTGHRDLADPERVAAGIDAAIARIEARQPGRSLVAVSALAEGADRLVVDAILRRPGSRLEAILPLPKFDFLDDFAGPASKEEFLRILARADSVTELPARASRDEAYAAANARLLEGIDVLVAVWDGQDMQDGQGAQVGAGTAAVVASARARGLPLAWVHAGNRRPGTPAEAPAADQGLVTVERF